MTNAPVSRRRRREQKICAAQRRRAENFLRGTWQQDPHMEYLLARRREALSLALQLPKLIAARHRPFGYAILEVAFSSLAKANRFAGKALP